MYDYLCKKTLGYKTLKKCIEDLERQGQLIRITEEVDPNLEMAAIHLRVNEANGPALLFENIIGSDFPAVSNLYGTKERAEYLFRDTLPHVKEIMQIAADPSSVLKNPFSGIKYIPSLIKALPRKQRHRTSRWKETTIDQLPMIKCWPMDGGAFITLPQVMTEDPDKKGIMGTNTGMYRIQLNGNFYTINKEVGMHYQIHRGIGVHHAKYNEINEDFKVSIFVGGPPSHALSAIFPLPEGLPEVTFAGIMNDRRYRYSQQNGHFYSNDADFVITGKIVKGKTKPEGPFGDHLGYYSLEHEFPVMEIDKVYHRKDAIWHFTVVGRPPAEDSMFGHLIHEIVKPMAMKEFPGLKEIHAVDAAGVHPLLLAIGEERYMPFRDKRPEEILTIANRILGSGQTSLAKYLIIIDHSDNKHLTTYDLPAFFKHVLERINWERDLHFQTKTTIDTLDYSGEGINEGSKLVMAVSGPKIRRLAEQTPPVPMHVNFKAGPMIAPGMLAVQGVEFTDYENERIQIENYAYTLPREDLEGIALIIICDDAEFISADFNNFIWATFTRSNPSHDIYGVDYFLENKHWGCKGPLIIDARIKPHHAPPLVKDEAVEEAIERFFVEGASLEGY